MMTMIIIMTTTMIEYLFKLLRILTSEIKMVPVMNLLFVVPDLVMVMSIK